MDYRDELTDEKVTAATARKTVEQHGLDWIDFMSDCGRREEYPATKVLEWLGY